MTIKRVLYENGLSLVLILLFLVFCGLQVWSGFSSFNEEQILHDQATIAFSQYIQRPDFWAALFENWESEFLQMAVLVVLAEKLRQKGSAQSRALEDGREEEEKQKQEIEEEARRQGKVPGPVRVGGWKLKLYSNSLTLAFSVLFLLSFAGHLVASFLKSRDEDISFNKPPGGFWDHLTSGQFWFESMQNWQSEFLAVFSIVVLSIWLRAKDSPESKPVGAAHDHTGT